jgi:hypothetical protein
VPPWRSQWPLNSLVDKYDLSSAKWALSAVRRSAAVARRHARLGTQLFQATA